MNIYMTEEEQVELLKKWWRNYGHYVWGGILAVVLSTVGYHWWQDRQNAIKVQASTAFESLMSKVAQNDVNGIKSQANYLKNNYSGTVYGSAGALLLAKEAVAGQKWKEAQKQLEWVVEKSTASSMRQIARLRLARLFLYKKNYEKALSTLMQVEEASFLPLVHELRGDILLAQEKKREAGEAYQQAIVTLPNRALASNQLQSKAQIYAIKGSN